MSDNTEQHITANVLHSLEQTPDPRLKTVLTSLITHLHAFIREVDLTELGGLDLDPSRVHDSAKPVGA